MTIPRGLVGACETSKKESHESALPAHRDRVVISIHYLRLLLNLIAVLCLRHARQSQPGQEDGTRQCNDERLQHLYTLGLCQGTHGEGENGGPRAAKCRAEPD